VLWTLEHEIPAQVRENKKIHGTKMLV
jgi:hypothetical protein